MSTHTTSGKEYRRAKNIVHTDSGKVMDCGCGHTVAASEGDKNKKCHGCGFMLYDPDPNDSNDSGGGCSDSGSNKSGQTSLSDF